MEQERYSSPEWDRVYESDEDYAMWLDSEYERWSNKENTGFESMGDYWMWIQQGVDLGFLTETTESGGYRAYE